MCNPPKHSKLQETPLKLDLWTAVHWDVGAGSFRAYHADIQSVHIHLYCHHHHYSQVLCTWQQALTAMFNGLRWLYLTTSMLARSLVADKLRVEDLTGAGDALSSALFVATVFGLIIQIALLVIYSPETADKMAKWLMLAKLQPLCFMLTSALTSVCSATPIK